MDIKVLIPAPTNYLQAKFCTIYNWKKMIISLIGKQWQVYRFYNKHRKVWKLIEKNCHGISCIVFFIGASAFIVIKEEKLVARRISVSTSSGSQNRSNSAQSRSDYGSLCILYSNTEKLSVRNGYDVTRLVATEHVRNKLSLLDSFTLFSVTLLI